MDDPYLRQLIKLWGMPKLEFVSGYQRTAIYQWRPSRCHVPPDAALRIGSFADDLGFAVENLCPGLPWHLLYRGRDRRNTDGLPSGAPVVTDIETAIKEIGVTEVSRAAGKSRQAIYDAAATKTPPVWLALAVEEASKQRYLVEDFRGDLPWWPLYGRHRQVHPIARPKGSVRAPLTEAAVAA